MAVCHTKQTAGRLIRTLVFLVGGSQNLWQQFPIATVTEIQRQGTFQAGNLCKKTLSAEIFIAEPLEVCLSWTRVWLFQVYLFT